MDTEFDLELALWRYSIISPLLHRKGNDVSLCDMLDSIAQSRYVRPDGNPVLVSAETMRKWLYRYNRGGLPALANKTRSDKGRQSVSESIAEAMATMRSEHPAWTLALVLRQLIDDGLWNGKRPSRSVLYRFANANNLMRSKGLPANPHLRPFAFDKFGQMWIADFMHGPKLQLGNKWCKSYLHVILDDCTRYVVSAKFYAQENTRSLIGELMTAVRRFGICQRFYTDNGSAYNSGHLKVVSANLGMIQPHTQPGQPQGRGKVERFMRTVREQLLAKMRYRSFDEINRGLVEFIEDYHHRPHTSLGCSPMQKRLSAQSVCRPVPEVADMEALFRTSRRCRVYNDGTIRLEKRIFEVPHCLPAKRIVVHYMPWDLSRVYYGDGLHLAREVDLVANAHRYHHPNFAHTKETSNDKR